MLQRRCEPWFLYNRHFSSGSQIPLCEHGWDGKSPGLPAFHQACELKHRRLDVLKMDIEGGEYAVTYDILNTGIEIDQLLLELKSINCCWNFTMPTPPYPCQKRSTPLLAFGRPVLSSSTSVRDPTRCPLSTNTPWEKGFDGLCSKGVQRCEK